MSRIGFIGLGNMGLPMARNIAAEKQHSIYVYDVNEEMLSDILWPDNVVPTSDILQLARHSEIIITCLPNISIVQQVYLGNNSILPELKQGTLAIDMSSSDPNLTVELGAALHQNGVNLIDAPVSGGVKKALSGELAILVGSDEADFKKVKPILSLMGDKIIHTGSLGSGQACKCLNNLCSATGLLIVAESLSLAERFGVTPETFIDVLNHSSGKNNSTENKFPQFILSEKFNSGFRMDLMNKDILTALNLAEAFNVDFSLSKTSVDKWKRAETELELGCDHTEIAGWQRDLS
jgi:3-hydroxyisobutyrate dehydrogenase